ncbi:MAG: CYTH domain-containing protein [Epulopiscium sp.]|nr:CYTH domain-containing protein [Candidatus Epulonipiscium sp.]
MEIEKKFLVHSLPENLSTYPYQEIIQGYICTDPVIRLRKSNNHYFLTVKTAGHLQREEIELPLTAEQFQSLWSKVDHTIIVKTRYLVPLDHQLTAEIDIFHKELDGLETIEVEFNSVKDAESFQPPIWFGKDVTHDNRYKNNNLALYGKPSE